MYWQIASSNLLFLKSNYRTKCSAINDTVLFISILQLVSSNQVLKLLTVGDVLCALFAICDGFGELAMTIDIT